MKKLILAILLFFPPSSFAAIEYCPDVYIADLWVMGARDDGLAMQNGLSMRLKDASGNYATCGGKDYVYMETDNPAYSGLLSMALAARMSAAKLQIAVNTSVENEYAYQLAYIKIISD